MDRNEEKGGRLQTQVMEKTLPFEITAEFTLPDYHSEISRLLWVRPTFLPPERFIGGGKADFSGRVLYEVLYTGPDGALYGVTPEEGYSLCVPLEGTWAPEDLQIFMEPTVDAVISRVMGPRKLSVRCRLHAHTRAFLQKTPQTVLRGSTDGICKLGDVLCTTRTLGETCEEFTLADSIKTAQRARAICARGSVFLPEVHPRTDAVHCRGEALITLLLCREEEGGGTPFCITQRIPFEKSIPLEGLAPDDHACVTGSVGQIELTPKEGGIDLNASIVLCAKAQTEEEVVILKDAFLPGADAECRFATQSFLQGGSCCNQNLSISAQGALPDGLGDEEHEILDAMAEAEICEKVADGTRFSLSGKLQCHLLCLRAGELFTQDATLPFRVILEGSDKTDVDCRVVNCRTSKSGGKLRADAELQFALYDLPQASVRLLEEASFTPRKVAPRAAIELYYPEVGQTLWSVAKQYGIPPQALADANALDADAPDDKDSLGGRRFLLIP